MVTSYEAMIDGAVQARQTAHEWRVMAAKATKDELVERYIREAERADERADWYEGRAAMCQFKEHEAA